MHYFCKLFGAWNKPSPLRDYFVQLTPAESSERSFSWKMRRKFSAHQIAGVKHCAVHEAFTASGSSLSGFTGTKQLLAFTAVMDRLCVLQRCRGSA